MKFIYAPVMGAILFGFVVNMFTAAQSPHLVILAAVVGAIFGIWSAIKY